MAARSPNSKILVLFDVDGTLTPSRKTITPVMKTFLSELRGRACTGMVGGSDLPKQVEQLGEDVLHMFDYVFPENGLRAYKGGVQIGETSMLDKLGEERIKAFVNFVLGYLSTLDIPKKRGTFIEFRKGMINVSPIGRNCSQAERDEFEEYDKAHSIRSTMISVLKEKFADYDLKYSIGGQISFDVFPVGWDKTFCLQYVKDAGFEEIHFFGDKTYEGGNDYEIFTSPDVKGHTVTCPEDTERMCRELWFQ